MSRQWTKMLGAMLLFPMLVAKQTKEQSFCRPDENENLNWCSHQLHAIALESTSSEKQISNNKYIVVNLRLADLPLQLSKPYFPASALETIPTVERGEK